MNLDRPEVNEMSEYDYELCGRLQDLNRTVFFSRDRALILEFHTELSLPEENHTGFKGVFTFRDKSKYIIY